MSKKTLSAICALLVAVILVLTAGIGSSWFTNGDITTWFNSWGQEKTDGDNTDGDKDKDGDNSNEKPDTSTVDGMIMPDEVNGEGVSVVSIPIPVALFSSYDISPLALSAYSLTATITPADADNKKVDWSVSWKNASSSWASGKTATNYVTVKAASDGALTANVECLQAFGEQIIITVTSRDNTNVKATVTVDYRERATGASLVLNGGGKDYAVNGVVQLPYDISLTPKVEIVSSAYTIKSNITTKIEIDLTSELCTALEKYDYDFSDIFKHIEISSLYSGEISLSKYLDTLSPVIFGYAGDTYYFSTMLSYIKNQYTGNVFEFKVTATNTTLGDTSTYSFYAPVDKTSMVVRAGRITLDKENITF